MKNPALPEQVDLWNRIQSFAIDEPDVSFPFSARLARENDWSLDFANQAIEEYKRFVYLALTAGHSITPSVEVDQVWHLHLTYTESYWDRFCREVLDQPFHHHPTKGGGEEGKKFDDWYRRTLASYEEAFGERPPSDIWPAPEQRFAKNSLIRQVSERTHWVVPKEKIRKYGISGGATAILLGIAGCASWNDAIVESEYFEYFPIVIFVGVCFWAFRNMGGGGGGRGRGGKGDSGGGCGAGCSASGCSSSGCGGGGCGGGGCGGCGG